MKVSEGIRSAAKTGKKILRAVRTGDSDHSERARKNLMYGSAFLAGASLCAMGAMFLLKSSAKSAAEHAAWKHEDKKLDDAINASLDASDPVAKY